MALATGSLLFFFFQAEDGIRDCSRDWSSDVCSSDLQQRQVAHVGDAPDVGQHVVEIGDAEVGHAERAGSDAGAGKIDRAVADALRHHGVIGADGADHLQGFFLGQRLPELRSGAHSRCLTLSRSSWSSFRVASILLRLNSEISMPLTIEYLPSLLVTGDRKSVV